MSARGSVAAAAMRTTTSAASAAGWTALMGFVGQARELAGTEGDDAADGVVRGHANGDPIAGHDLDAKPSHPAAELGQHFVARIDLHAIETAAVDRHNGALNIN